MKQQAKWLAFILLGGLSLSCPRPAAASETDALLNKLVQKGILSSEEAQEVRNEMAKESGPAAESRAADTKDVVKKMAGGTWLDTVKWGGDLRLRFEQQMREPAVDRTRERYRLRFGFVAKPWDPLEVGVRLASAGASTTAGNGGDPLATNQTFTSSFDKKPIFVDQAYAKYTPWKAGTGPLSGLSVTGGKMEIPFVTIPEGIVWDNDITPEGAAIQWKDPANLPLLDRILPVRPFANVGAFQISELANDEGDPGIIGYQAGADIDLPFWGAGFQPSVAYYDFVGIKGIATANVTGAPAGNTTTSGRFTTDYNLVTTQGKLTFPSVLGQPVALLADYTYNNYKHVGGGSEADAVDDGGGTTFGMEVGKVTEKFGSWKAYVFRKRVEPDATFGTFSDSDFGSGGTNHKGYILGAQMGLNKWASVGVKYFRTDEIEGTQNKVDTFQADVLLKY